MKNNIKLNARMIPIYFNTYLCSYSIKGDSEKFYCGVYAKDRRSAHRTIYMNHPKAFNIKKEKCPITIIERTTIKEILYQLERNK